MTRVIFIADASFARREHRLLNRLDVGLSDEGVRVTLAAPEGALPARRGSLSDVLDYESPSPFVTTHMRAVRLVESLGRAGVGDDDIVVHAWGERGWGLALEVANLLGAALVLEVWAARLVRRLGPLERRARRMRGLGPVLYCAPSTALRDAIDRSRVRRPVRLVHWGVYASTALRARPDASPPSVAILATGDDPAGIGAAIEGAAAIANQRNDLLVLLDDRAVHRQPDLWAQVRDAALLDNLTLVADMEQQREAVLEADVLVQPEACGAIRSITLDALASGMVLVAQRDPVSDTLSAETPAILLEDCSARAWERALREALADAQGAQTRARAGLDFVRKSRRASDHVAALLRIYDGIAAPTPDDAPRA